MARSVPNPHSLGLRERKKRETRQRISDLATEMFLDRGYDAVRVADVAERAGVSEKTVFNYFPTKESLVFDHTDEQLVAMVDAVRACPPHQSPTHAYVAAMFAQFELLAQIPAPDLRATVPRFTAMIDTTPALRAAWGDHRHRMVAALSDVLAEQAGTDPLEPEVRTAARALVSLTELGFDAMTRHLAATRTTPELLVRVREDLDRAAATLDAGLWPARPPRPTPPPGPPSPLNHP